MLTQSSNKTFSFVCATIPAAVWKELAAGLQAEGKDADDGGTVSVKAPDAVKASALKS